MWPTHHERKMLYTPYCMWLGSGKTRPVCTLESRAQMLLRPAVRANIQRVEFKRRRKVRRTTCESQPTHGDERSVCSQNAIPCDHFSETISFTPPRTQPHGRYMSRLPGDVGFTSSSALLFASSPALSVSCARSLTNSARYVPMMWSKVVASTLFLARSSSICGSCTSVRLHKHVLSLPHSLTLSLPLPLPRTETGVNQKDRTNADYCSIRKRDPGRVTPVMASTTGAACERDTYHAGENS